MFNRNSTSYVQLSTPNDRLNAEFLTRLSALSNSGIITSAERETIELEYAEAVDAEAEGSEGEYQAIVSFLARLG